MPNASSLRQIVKVASPLDLAERAAQSLARIVDEAVAARGAAFIALSGGSTPKAIYARLCQSDYLQSMPWSKIHFFVSDERCVSLESDESNYGNADRLLFSKLINKPELHPPGNQEANPAGSALDYESEVSSIVPSDGTGVPRFDLIFLGMGPDGHTASLFPGTAALAEKERLVVENFVPKVNANRITFTYRLLNAARNVVFVVGGQDKAAVVKEILQDGSVQFPSALVDPLEGNLVWMLDSAAAANLSDAIR